MNSPTIGILPEKPCHQLEIEKLVSQAFGPGRFVRAAYRLRAGIPHEPELSFVARISETSNRGGLVGLVGSVRQTKILIGERPGLLLGPLVVAPGAKNLGIGRELMNRTITAARQAGHDIVLLVGDLPYYARFGFVAIPPGQVVLPGPADPARILACPLIKGAEERFEGLSQTVRQNNNTR